MKNIMKFADIWSDEEAEAMKKTIRELSRKSIEELIRRTNKRKTKAGDIFGLLEGELKDTRELLAEVDKDFGDDE